jgi:uncharacterized protein (TIGR02145 family)
MVVETSDATDVGGDTGTLQGKVLHDGGSNLVATGFKWGLQADLSGAADTVVTMAADSTFAAVLTGLTVGSTYYFSAYSTNASGTVYGDTLSFVVSCSPPSDLPGCNGGSLTSYEYQGYDYRLVEINGLCWFAENLRNENYNDGTAIPSGMASTGFGNAWSTTTDGAVTVYGEGGAYEATFLADYGRLYNWYAVNTGNLCPSGWHVPTEAEWTTLTDGLGGVTVAGDALKSSPSDNPAWDGTNSSGFSALAGGYRGDNGLFGSGGNRGYFWSSSPYGTFSSYQILNGGNTEVTTTYADQGSGLSVRCVLD